MCPVKREPRRRVCVIGAGVCGLVSVKSCLELGFDVTCYDRSSQIGGLWCYKPTAGADHPDEASVMRTTILNTSKELSAFSDFPPPAHLANYMRHTEYMNYIRSYVDHFKLRPHIQLRHQILRCKPSWNSDQRAVEWEVEMKSLDSNQVRTQIFDHLMIAIGHHNVPHVPTFKGQHKFKGQILHSIKVKDILTDQRLADKRVCVVGFGNSACDAACDLSLVAEKCYISSHRGNWILNRQTLDGLYERKHKCRWSNVQSSLVPRCLTDRVIINYCERRTNHQLLGLRPKHMPSEQVPILNDLLPYKIMTGGVILKNSIETFTENGIIFDGEPEHEYELDVVILATGYTAQVPFLDEFKLGLKSAADSEYELFLNMFPAHLRLHPAADQTTKLSDDESSLSRKLMKSLVFIGHVQPSGSITVVSELQARYACQVFAGKCQLPPTEQMLAQIEQSKRVRSRAIRSHSRDQLIGNWLQCLDQIADQFGVRPNMAKLFLSDFKLWRKLLFGPAVPYQFRLQGPGKWEKARETILGAEQRIVAGINGGKNHVLYQRRRKCLNEPAAKQKASQKLA